MNNEKHSQSLLMQGLEDSLIDLDCTVFQYFGKTYDAIKVTTSTAFKIQKSIDYVVQFLNELGSSLVLESKTKNFCFDAFITQKNSIDLFFFNHTNKLKKLDEFDSKIKEFYNTFGKGTTVIVAHLVQSHFNNYSTIVYNNIGVSQ